MAVRSRNSLFIFGGLFSLVLLASLPVNVKAQKILFHGGAAGPTQGTDGDVFDHLEARYGAGSVTYMEGNAAAADGSSANGFNIVIISSTLGSGSVRNKYEDVAIPVLNWEQALTDSSSAGDFFLSGTARTNGGQSAIDIVKPEHFIPSAAGELTGTVTVMDSPQTFSLGTGPDLGEGVELIATVDGSPNDFAIMVAEPFAPLLGDGSDGSPESVGARRSFFFLEDSSFTALTEDGLNLFDATVDWTLGLDVTTGEPGDFNDDGSVDLADFDILRSNFLGKFSFSESFAKGDGNRDTKVDLKDFLEFADIFAAANPGAASVPEPSSLVLATCGLLGLWGYRRRSRFLP